MPRGNNELDIEFIKIAIDEVGDELKSQILALINGRISIQDQEQYVSEASYIVHLREDMDKRLESLRNK